MGLLLQTCAADQERAGQLGMAPATGAAPFSHVPQLKVDVPVEEVIATAQAAGRAILKIYNSEVGFACALLEVSLSQACRRPFPEHCAPPKRHTLGPAPCRCVLQASTWEVQLKSDASPLTRADRDANAVICQALQNLTPHIPIVSEEEKMLPHSIRQARH